MRFLSFLILLGLLWSCNSDVPSHPEVDQWNSYELSKGVKAAFPQQPTRKVSDFDPAKSIEHRIERKDSFNSVYSVNLITNEELKSTEDWENYFKEFLDGFKNVSTERNTVQWKGQQAVFSKVRQGTLYGLSLNLVVADQFILNMAMRRLGAYPEQELFDAFCARVEVK